MRTSIPLHLIDPNPNNPRKVYTRIEELADTIFECGLINNLVVKRAGDRFEVRAGHRRRKALLLLVEQGRIQDDHPVPCFVIDREGDIEAIVENVQREPLPPWEDGAAYERLVEKYGMTHEQIGKAIGRSRSHVTKSITISRGLSPKIVPVLIRIGSAGPNFLELLRLAQMTDKVTSQPDHDKQRKWLESFVTRGTKGRKKKYKTTRYYSDRLRALERMEFSRDIEVVVQAVVRYLNGEPMVLPHLETEKEVRA
jgi:ParB/RepB/Spo0J family partition protein